MSKVSKTLETHCARTHGSRSGTVAAMAFFLRCFGNHSFGRNQQTADGSCILQSGTNHFGRVNNAGFNHVGIFAVLSIETIIGIFAFQQLAGNNRTVQTCIFNNLTDRRLRGFTNNVNTDF